MKIPPSPALLGALLLALAGAFIVSIRPGVEFTQDKSRTESGPRSSGKPSSDLTTKGSGPETKEPEKFQLSLDAEGIADFSNYDRNGDGDPEIGAFLEVYRRLNTSTGKIDMLDHVRTFDSRDEPELNDLLIEQAARAEDPDVRTAAREALFEHGGEKAHAALAAYLKSETRAADVPELEKLLDIFQRQTLSQFKSANRSGSTRPPHPDNNQQNQ